VLRIAPDVLARLRAEAEQAAPAECCGLLAGSDAGGVRSIVAARACRNAAAHAQWEFRAHPQDQLDALLAFEEQGLAVLGVYHSHPRGPPHPSTVDAARAGEPGWTWVVLWPGGWGAWRWTGRAFVPEGSDLDTPKAPKP
jgi:proteasome lid subunit RPN8/RPN11